MEHEFNEYNSAAADVPLYLTPAPCSVNDKEGWESHCLSQYWYYYKWFMDWMNEYAGDNVQTDRNDSCDTMLDKDGREVCPQYNADGGVVDVALQTLHISDNSGYGRSSANDPKQNNEDSGKNPTSSNKAPEVNSHPVSSSQVTIRRSPILNGGGDPPEEEENGKKLKSSHELDDTAVGLYESNLIIQCFI